VTAADEPPHRATCGPVHRRRDRTARRRVVAVAVVAALVVAGCSGSSGPTADAGTRATTTLAPGKAPGPSGSDVAGGAGPRPSVGSDRPVAGAGAVAPMGTYAVGATTVDLVDADRDTPANGTAPATEGRKLPTVAFYPAAGLPGAVPAEPAVRDEAEARPGPYPLIVFSHGVTARGIFYRGQLAALASAGYVVVAPDYPLSNRQSPGGPTISDVANQPGDASFLIDAFTDPDGPSPAAAVAELVDPDRIGAAGHSLGAVTSLGLGYGACCVEDRVDAVASWAGLLLPMRGQEIPAPGITDRPLLLVHGDADATVPYASSESAFEAIESPRWFISLPGGEHTPPFLSPTSSETSAVVTDATLAFFDAQLKGDADGIDRLEAIVTAAGPDVATLRSAA
jgi:fermentation-respiration switch protein FrsA (DUF1100 family)